MKLFDAVQKGRLAIVRYLAKAGQDIHVRYKSVCGGSLLHVASRNGHVELLQYLTGLGLDPFVLDMHDETLLHYACGCGQFEMSKFLITTYPTMKQKSDKFQRTALHHAAGSGDIKLFEYLIKETLDVNHVAAEGISVLHCACWFVSLTEHGYETVKYIVTKHPTLRDKVDNDGYTALHYTAMSGDVKTFKLLVDKGMDVCAEAKNGENVLMLACKGLQIENVQINNLQVVTYLVRKYPNLVNKRDKDGRSVLHYTADGGNTEILTFLLGKGLDVFDTDRENRTLLHASCEKGQYKMVKYLITNHPELGSMETAKKETPLLLAARGEHDDVIVCLLDNVPDVMDKTLSITTSKSKGLDYLKTFAVQKSMSLKTQLGKREETSTADTEASVEDREEHIRHWLDEVEFYSRTSTRTSTSGFVDESSCVASTSPHNSMQASNIDPDLEQDELHWSGTDFLNPSMIRKIIKNKGHFAKETDVSLQWLCSRVEEQYPDVDGVTVGYYQENEAEPVLLAFVKELTPTQGTLDSFCLVIRKRGKVSGEAKHIVELEMKKDFQFSLEERSRVHKTLAKHSKHLMDAHSNLEILGASKLKSKGYGKQNAIVEEQTCIVFYVPVKGIIPFREKPFPSELDGFIVDVRESRFQLYSDPCKYHDRLLMGCQISSAYGRSGSLGGFVELDKGRICCITSWHLFLTDVSKTDLSNYALNVDVFQPDNSSPSFQFGSLVKIATHTGDEKSIGVEAALVEVTDQVRLPLHGRFPNATKDIAGFSEDKPMEFSSGRIVTSFEEVQKTCNVVKYGSRTEHTVGMLRLSGTAVRKERFTYYTTPDLKETFELYQQFEIFHPEGHPFSTFGDSGSLVFHVSDKGNDDYDIRALGILVGGTLHNTTIVTPIWAVLEQFSLPMKLLSFDMANTRTQTGGTASSVRLDTDVADLKAELTTFKTEVASKFDTLERNVASMMQSADTKLDKLLNLSKRQSNKQTEDATHMSVDEDES